MILGCALNFTLVDHFPIVCVSSAIMRNLGGFHFLVPPYTNFHSWASIPPADFNGTSLISTQTRWISEESFREVRFGHIRTGFLKFRIAVAVRYQVIIIIISIL